MQGRSLAGDRGLSRIKVYISYARGDATFADRLATALMADERYWAYLDRKDISGEDWQARLVQLIQEADNVVFVISPNSIASKTCNWEIQEAQRLGKRIVPVVLHVVDVKSIPSEISKLNFVFFDDEASFSRSIDFLLEILQTDSAWIRQHTHIGTLANLWQANGRHDDFLLRGAALKEAEDWVEARPKGAQALTALQLDFIRESRKVEQKAQPLGFWFSPKGKLSRPEPKPLGGKIFISYRRSDRPMHQPIFISVYAMNFITTKSSLMSTRSQWE